MNQEEADKLMVAAINKRVQRGRRVTLGAVGRPSFTPPPCARPGCPSLADIEERDFDPTRPFFCEADCFRLVRQFVTESEQHTGVIPKLAMYPLWLAWKTTLKGLEPLDDLSREARRKAGQRSAELRRSPQRV